MTGFSRYSGLGYLLLSSAAHPILRGIGYCIPSGLGFDGENSLT
jgi:hypothetical protein